MPRFVHRPAILKTPSLDLPQKHGGGVSTRTILMRHREEAGAQFVRGSCVPREDVRLIAVGLSLDESVFQLLPYTSRNRRGPRVIDHVQIGEQVLRRSQAGYDS